LLPNNGNAKKPQCPLVFYVILGGKTPTFPRISDTGIEPVSPVLASVLTSTPIGYKQFNEMLSSNP
jgi:hypothetical protein